MLTPASLFVYCIQSTVLQPTRASIRGIAKGAADSAILGFAHDSGFDMLVMSTHWRTGPLKAMMGSVAEKVMLTMKRPVMPVKPERLPPAHHADEADVFLSAH